MAYFYVICRKCQIHLAALLLFSAHIMLLTITYNASSMKRLSISVLIILTCYFSSAQTHSQSGILTGKWLFVSSSEIDLGKIPDSQLPDLLIDDSAKSFSGSAGCNRINGSYEAEAEEFAFGPMLSTFKACPDMQVEKYITRFLPSVGSYKVEDNRLYLYEKNDKSRFIVYRRNG